MPDPGQGLFYGLLEPNEETVIEEMARKMLTSPNATIFPGPLLLWAWNDHAVEKAKALSEKAQGGALRQLQVDAARRATANVHKPEAAQTRELEIDPRAMKASGKSRRDILGSILTNEAKKRGFDL